MRNKMIAVGVLAVSLLMLTGCDDNPPPKSSIELGKECFDAGGEWQWNGWDGYHCEFLREGNN